MSRGCLAALVLLASGGGSAAFAQDIAGQAEAAQAALALGQTPPPTGSSLTAVLSQSFAADTNYNLDDPSPGNTYYADTRVNLGYSSVTDTQTFTLGLDTGLRALWQADQPYDTTFASPSTANLEYQQEWAGAKLDANLEYFQAEVDVTRPLSDVFGPGVTPLPQDLNKLQGNATEQRWDGLIDLALQTDAPSSYDFTLSATKIGYSQESTNQVPQSSVIGTGEWDLELNPVLSSSLVGSYFYYAGEDAASTELQIGQVTAGLIYAPGDIWSVRGGVGYAKRTRQQTINDERTTNQDDAGLVVNGGFDYELPYVVISADGRVTNAAPDTRFIGNVTASYALVRGNVYARIYQDYSADGAGNEIKLQGAGIGVNHLINTLSQFTFAFDAAKQVNVDIPTEADITRVDFSAVYTYNVTEAVSTSLGYALRVLDESPDNATSNAVFFTVARAFETQP